MGGGVERKVRHLGNIRLDLPRFGRVGVELSTTLGNLRQSLLLLAHCKLYGQRTGIFDMTSMLEIYAVRVCLRKVGGYPRTILDCPEAYRHAIPSGKEKPVQHFSRIVL